jgi:putative hydrolase of the HAD superfamily
MKAPEIWKNLGAKHLYPDIEKEFLDKRFKIDKTFYNVVKKLKKSYNLAVLSNDVKEWSAYLRKKYDLNKYFKVVVISGDVKARKPDKKIFDILLRKLKTAPKNCVFIDDKSRNLIAAAKRGFKTIKFARKALKDKFRPDCKIKSFKEINKVLNITSKGVMHER